ncbi:MULTISPECIES: DUF3696 domain-containing protein [unclassified Xanthomonas]|uniref:DUF3696 domain-containing protein n=1 Tax=unclassified Xanthomonas TaxID=2643310 RepID=UPI002A83B25F|nr:MULTISPECIES: DUF3696 domain-containing protein [unclassified Xanthomonas]MDY4295811.1 DUF3696 domain-containing protein [Xanthomonas sp. LF02-5]MDY4357605.1 DUF3696 domain-containing protein [Xanthomonas sp. LF04-12]
MSIKTLALRNFKRFDRFSIDLDRGVIAILGENSSGKSSILKAILGLKQTVAASNEHEGWAANGEYVDLGTYRDYIHKKDIKKAFAISLTLNADTLDPNSLMSSIVKNAAAVNLTLEYDYDSITAQARFKEIKVNFMQPASNMSWLIQRQKTRNSYALTFSKSLIAAFKKNFPLPQSDGELQVGEKIILQHLERFSFELDKKIGFTTYLAFRLVSENLASLSEYLEKKVFYLAPLRSSPSRSYVRSSHNLAVGVGGEHTPSVLANLESRARKATTGHSEIRDRLDWLKKAIAKIFPGHVVATKTYDELVKLMVSSPSTATYASSDKSDAITDVGFGFSQVLPILVQIAVMPHGGVLLIEQPELHLHPVAQTRLGEVMAEAIHAGKQIIVETHSEHFVRGLQLSVSANRKSNKLIEAISIRFYYLKRGSSSCLPLEMNEFGELLHEWPSGFFDESYKSLRILLANKMGDSQ